MSKDQLEVRDAERTSGWGKDDGRNKVNWSKIAKARVRRLKTKVYHCPVHRKEKIVGHMKWALHRRWCRAGAGQPRRAMITQKRNERLASTLAAHEMSHAVETSQGIQFDVHRSSLVLKNENSEITVATFVHGSNLAKLGKAIRQLVRTGMRPEELVK